MNRCDGVLVLGGGVRDGGRLPPWAIQRFERALEIDSQAPIVCLSAGTVHRPPPLNSDGFPWLESAAGASYLLSKGVPPNRIQVEACSYDTIGNAYFARLLHVDPAGWTHVIVITSEFHMPRSRAIFDWVFGMAPATCTLQFETSSNAGLEGPLLQRRMEKEAQALEALRALMRRIPDLRSLHHFIHTEHTAYNAQGWTQRRPSAAELVEIY